MSKMSELEGMRRQVEEVTGPLVEVVGVTGDLQRWYDGLWTINQFLMDGKIVEAAVRVEQMRAGIGWTIGHLESPGKM